MERGTPTKRRTLARSAETVKGQESVRGGRAPGRNVRLAVLDRVALEGVAKWVAASRWRLAVPKATLSRLRRGVNGRGEPLEDIEADTLATLQAVLIEDASAQAQRLYEQLEDAVLSEGGVVMRLFYKGWLHARRHDFFFRPEDRYDLINDREFGLLPKHTGEDERYFEAALGEELSGLPLWRYRNYLALRNRIAQAPGAAGALRSFSDELRARQGESDAAEREQLAIFRILAPLLEGPEAVFLEPQWEELDAEELEDFVRAGVERERILFRRRGGLTKRIQHILRHGPQPVERLEALPQDPLNLVPRRTTSRLATSHRGNSRQKAEPPVVRAR